MSKRVITALTLALIFSLFAVGTQNQPVSANAAATAKATEKPEGTKEAKDSPFCAGINPNAATLEAGAPEQQPRAARIAAAYKVPYKDVIGWFCKGYGMGQIDRAYAIAAASAKKGKALKAADVFAKLAAGENWKQIITDADISMKDVNQARKAAFGNGKGKGNANANGKGQGKVKGKGNKGDDKDDDKD
jgi:hypothetical protein